MAQLQCRERISQSWILPFVIEKAVPTPLPELYSLCCHDPSNDTHNLQRPTPQLPISCYCLQLSQCQCEASLKDSHNFF